MVVEDVFRRIVREELSVLAVELGRNFKPPEDEFLGIAGAAALLGVSVTTVRKWIRTGRLRRYGSGRAVRIRRSELFAMNDEGKSGSPMWAKERADALLQKGR